MTLNGHSVSTRNDEFDRGEILGIGEVGSLAIDGLIVDAGAGVLAFGVSAWSLLLLSSSGDFAGVCLAGVVTLLGSCPLAGSVVPLSSRAPRSKAELAFE